MVILTYLIECARSRRIVSVQMLDFFNNFGENVAFVKEIAVAQEV